MGGTSTDALPAISADQALTNGVTDKLEALPDVVEVRLANFGDSNTPELDALLPSILDKAFKGEL